MKKLILLFTAILVYAGAALGQVGYIGLYVDHTYTWCQYYDYGAALVPVYAVHKMTPGATGSQWRIQTSGDFTCTYTGEVIQVPTSSGDTQTGLTASYGACLASDILIATINYFCMGTSPTCARIDVVGHPTSVSGEVEVTDCGYVTHQAQGWSIIMNNDGTCGFCQPHPVESTSWGSVKALYR